MKDITPQSKKDTNETSSRSASKRSITGDLIHTGILIAIAIAVLVGSSWLVIPHMQNDSTVALADDPILKREVIDYTELTSKEGDMVKYSYVGQKLPEKLNEKEVVPMRTENSYTIDKGVLENGKVGRNLQAIIYSQPAFIKKANTWYYREYAITSKKNFDLARRTNPLTMFFAIPKVYADQFFAGAGDGFVEYSDTNSWAAAHDATTGNSFSYTTGTTTAGSDYISIKTATWQIDRAFFPFDTSSIPSGSKISSATLNVYVTFTLNGVNDGIDYLTVVQTSQSTHTQLANADYNKCGAVTTPTEGIDTSERKDLTSVSQYTYLTFTLNSTGLGWIKKSGQASNCTSTNGISCIGVREGHDASNTTIGTASSDYGQMSTSETAGTNNDPYLSVSYSTFAPWQFWDY